MIEAGRVPNQSQSGDASRAIAGRGRIDEPVLSVWRARREIRGHEPPMATSCTGDYPVPNGLVKPDVVAFPGAGYPVRAAVRAARAERR